MTLNDGPTRPAYAEAIEPPALWRRDPGDPPAGDAVLHRLPDLPLGVLLDRFGLGVEVTGPMTFEASVFRGEEPDQDTAG